MANIDDITNSIQDLSSTTTAWMDAAKDAMTSIKNDVDGLQGLRGDYKPYLCLTCAGSGTINLNKVGTPYTIDLEYSTDKETWTKYTWIGNTGATITLSAAGSVWFRNDSGLFSKDWDNRYLFVLSTTSPWYASGSIMSLLNKDAVTTSVPNLAFDRLFMGCSSLYSAPELPATTIGTKAYEFLFQNTAIIRAPELPARIAPAGCYGGMFYGTPLRYAPELPAVTIGNQCYYQMFYGCTQLIEAPYLPATTLASQCYYQMFYGCTSLRRVSVGFTAWGSNNETSNWLYNCGFNFTKRLNFACPKSLPYVAGNSNIPQYSEIEYIQYDFPNAMAMNTQGGYIEFQGCKTVNKITVDSATQSYSVNTYNKGYIDVVAINHDISLHRLPISYWIYNTGAGTIAYCEVVLDIAAGVVVTPLAASDNATYGFVYADALTAGKRNVCVIRSESEAQNEPGRASLYVVSVEDLPA